MINHDEKLKNLLNREFENRNNFYEISYEKPDPLLIAKRHKDEYIILLCALFAYGNAKLIVKFLDSLNFELLDLNEDVIEKELNNKYYRFQNSNDIISIFITLKRLKNEDSLQNIFYEAYKKDNLVLEGIDSLIQRFYKNSKYSSQGFNFLISKPFKRDKQGRIKEIGNSTYKRWNMFLRWMVRSDNIDLGYWNKINKKDLILPLDTHTFSISKRIGLLERKNYDLKSALLITQKLKEFDFNDPIKYDFAIYRIGQEKLFKDFNKS